MTWAAVWRFVRNVPGWAWGVIVALLGVAVAWQARQDAKRAEAKATALGLQTTVARAEAHRARTQAIVEQERAQAVSAATVAHAAEAARLDAKAAAVSEITDPAAVVAEFDAAFKDKP